jgi:glycosyltransferase involved in cell wall biosynthesis
MRDSQMQAASQPRRIRLFFLIPSFKTGGAELQLLSLLRGLDKTRFEITIAAFYRGNEYDAAFEAIPGVSVLYLEKKGALDFRLVRRLMDFFRHHPVDIVQCTNVSARLVGVFCAKRARVPVIIATERTARLLYLSFGSRIYLFFEKYALRSADLVIANSNAGRKFVMSRGVAEERTRVIYNGVDPERVSSNRSPRQMRQELALPDKAFVVGMVARLEVLKDPALFITACGRMMSRFPNVYALLVGDGSLLNDMKFLAQQTDFSERIIFTGRRADVADVLQVMDVVLLTSRKIEGCSNSLLEAMALGKAVIATAVGGTVELIEHEQNGILVAPGNSNELADAVCRVYHDAGLRERLGKNARDTAAKQFSQAAMVRAYEATFIDLLARKSGDLIRSAKDE